ncbi:MAG: type IX secretion system membrane protein PorP/SprF [Bacteroidales bacterium]|nr:type IX secretion system membrane protein PorP/SprF [Bacteroidales bacterium]
METKLIKKALLLLMIVAFSCPVRAQLETQYTQYMFNLLSFNPAYAGSSGSICASTLYRNQWMGLRLDSPAPDMRAGVTPTDYMFTFDMPVHFLHGGIGLNVFHEGIGYHSATGLTFDYAFRLYWGPGNLAAAVEANFNSTSFDFTQLVGSNDFTGNATNPISSANDPLLNGSADESDFLIDVSTGLFYQVPGTYYIGLSAKNLLAAKSEVLHFQNSRVFYLMGGYEWVIPTNPSFKLKPSAMIKTANFATFTAEASCLVDYRNAFWLGGAYRLQDGISILGGVNWNKFKLGLSYDLTTSKLGTFKMNRSAGTLELYLRFCFKVPEQPKYPSSYRNTRYLF